MKKLISLAVLNILFLFFMSFKLGESANKSNKFSIRDFPMTVGSQWTYVRIDTSANSGTRPPLIVVETDTITAEITKKNRGKNKEIISELVTTFKNKVDTQYVVIKKDSLKVFASLEPGRRYIVYQFLFPLKIDNSRSGPPEYPGLDSYKVMQPESVTVAAEIFTNAYLIMRKTWNPNNPGEIKYWIVPQIGIVKIRKWDFLFGESTIENWDLIAYDIKK